MPDEYKEERLKPRTPASYRIDVEGYPDEGWSECLGGMKIKKRKRADQSCVTTLVGRMREHTELAGVLNTL